MMGHLHADTAVISCQLRLQEDRPCSSHVMPMYATSKSYATLVDSRPEHSFLSEHTTNIDIIMFQKSSL